MPSEPAVFDGFEQERGQAGLAQPQVGPERGEETTPREYAERPSLVNILISHRQDSVTKLAWIQICLRARMRTSATGSRRLCAHITGVGSRAWAGEPRSSLRLVSGPTMTHRP